MWTFCLAMHSMRCTAEQTLQENYDLKQKTSRFWEIENVNPFDECAINLLVKDIVSNTERDTSRDFLLKKTVIFCLAI